MNFSDNSKKTIVRNKGELPKWFNIKKYAAAKDLTAENWYDLLVQRWSHNYYYDRFASEKYTKHEVLYPALINLRENPLKSLTDDQHIMFIGGGKLLALKYNPKDFVHFAHALSPLTIRQLYQIEGSLEPKSRIREYMDKILELNGDAWPSEKEHEWALSFIDEPIFDALKKLGDSKKSRSHDFIKIDLSVPDKILIEQFADYLRQLRKRNPDIKPAKPYKAPEFKKLAEYGVLPYLDLKFWEKENNASIPYRVLADALFPTGNIGEEMIRKTTKKFSEQVIEADYIDFLATIAAQEITERN